jgi:membrane-associated protein
MEWIMTLISWTLHVDQHLTDFVRDHGVWVYGLLFLIVFVETGLVVMPFLPGDSLLFVVGALGGLGLIDTPTAMALVWVAAVLGDQVNYTIGQRVGLRLLAMPPKPWFNRKAYDQAHDFYLRHGPVTIVIARFMPFIRTFAPFVAGVSDMGLTRFQVFNVVGALLWVIGLVMAGYFFGNIPIIRDHLNTIVLIGIAAAAGPVALAAIIRFVRKRLRGAQSES